MDLAVIAIVFGAIFLVELPDKTFIAALVLSTRYRPLAVWIGVGLAFFVQTLIAVLAGHAGDVPAGDADQVGRAGDLPDRCRGPVPVGARRGRGGEARPRRSTPRKAAEARTGLKAVGASFLVLFAAEWGDLSQLLTISMIAKYGHPVSVFIGAWAALLDRLGPGRARRPGAAAPREALGDPLRRRQRSACVLAARHRRTSCSLRLSPTARLGCTMSDVTTAAVAEPGVSSEVGRLRTVMLHRPGPELQRLTPRNNDKLLFDGIPWVTPGPGGARRLRRGAAQPRRRGALPDRPARRDAGQRGGPARMRSTR